MMGTRKLSEFLSCLLHFADDIVSYLLRFDLTCFQVITSKDKNMEKLHDLLTSAESDSAQAIIDESCLLNAGVFELEGREYVDRLVERSCGHLDYPPSIYKIIGDLVEAHLANLLAWKDRLQDVAEEAGLPEADVDAVLESLDQNGPRAACEALTRAMQFGWVKYSMRTQSLESAWQDDPSPSIVHDGKRWSVSARFVDLTGRSQFLIRSGDQFKAASGSMQIIVNNTSLRRIL